MRQRRFEAIAVVSVVSVVSWGWLSAVLSGCSRPTPAAAVETAVRRLYVAPLGNRDSERDVLRVNGTEKLRGAMVALDASCSEILASDQPNHGLRGPAAADFERTCLQWGPLSCGHAGAVLTAVEVPSVVGDGATAIARITPAGGAPVGVELGLRAVDNVWKVDETRCP